MKKPSHVMGNIKVKEAINEKGQIKDINGESWDVISVWGSGEYVTASKTSELTNEYSRWSPYEVMVVGNEIN
jgi:hypothetical protein